MRTLAVLDHDVLGDNTSVAFVEDNATWIGMDNF